MNQALASTTALRVMPFLEEGTADLGPIKVRDDIQSHMGPFKTLPQYRTVYPPVVIAALTELYQEYNGHFGPLADANREHATDYQHCVDRTGQPLNRWVQIDMVGLPAGFLELASHFSVAEVKRALRHCIFEIENSLAMYQLLERVTPSDLFRQTFRASLQELRDRFGKPIAILAVTPEKYEALLADEFGKWPGDPITDAEVRELSGFDRLFSPDQFRAHVAENDGESQYLLYVRSSDPTAKLKNLGLEVEHPLLSDPEMRRIIRANSVTFNIDDPDSGPGQRINDTKAYMPPMGMAFVITKETDLVTPEFLKHLQKGRLAEHFQGTRLQPEFVAYLEATGADPAAFATGERKIRAKPLKGTYGCYGHYTLDLTRGGKRRGEWRKQLALRGEYVVQPELPSPFIVDPASGKTYGYIDRNFFTMLKGVPVFMGGFRSMLPLASEEAQKGRFHGNRDTVWAAID